MNPIPTNWPFPLVNNQRTPESQTLLDTKRHVSNAALERKAVLAQADEALF